MFQFAKLTQSLNPLKVISNNGFWQQTAYVDVSDRLKCRSIKFKNYTHIGALSSKVATIT